MKGKKKLKIIKMTVECAILAGFAFIAQGDMCPNCGDSGGYVSGGGYCLNCWMRKMIGEKCLNCKDAEILTLGPFCPECSSRFRNKLYCAILDPVMIDFCLQNSKQVGDLGRAINMAYDDRKKQEDDSHLTSGEVEFLREVICVLNEHGGTSALEEVFQNNKRPLAKIRDD